MLLALVEEAIVLAHGLIHDVAPHEGLRFRSTLLRVLAISQLCLGCAYINVI